MGLTSQRWNKTEIRRSLLEWKLLNRKRQVSRFETDLSLSVAEKKERLFMKIKRILSAGVLTALLAFSAFAEVKGKSIAFSKDVTVNGMTVKEGTYRVEFDSEKSELSFVKNGKVVAKATAHAEAAPAIATGTRIETKQTENGDLLVAITFSGSHQRIVVANGEGVGPSMK
jgi:hypothetical protein